MSRKLFTIPAAPEIGVKLEAQARKSLGSKPGPYLADELLHTRNKALSLMGYIRLKLLHRQFSGKAIPGLRLVVRSARHTMRGIRRIPLLRKQVAPK